VETFYFILLVVLAFCLGACPFALWVGKWLLGKDIRNYGDGNPGAYNVMRAGGRWSFALALFLDIGKGIPFVALASHYYGLPLFMVLAIGLSAILGHAFTPILRFDGGKALAVMGGVMLGLPQLDMFVATVIFMLLGFLLIEVDAWRVMFGTTGTLIYSAVTKGVSLEPLFMLCVIAILVVKHFDDLKTRPRLRGKLISWLQGRRTAHISRH
jgi:glycerol-3-phosphate acyltransferase PlsY